MKKIIKKWGDSLIIRFSPEEAKIFKLETGKVIEISDKNFKKKEKKKK